MAESEKTLLQLSLTVPVGLAEKVVAHLAELCPEGFEEHDEDGGANTRFVLYGEGPRADALQAQVNELAEALRSGQGAGTPITLGAARIENKNWREAWKVHFQIQHIDRFVIQPSWLEYTPQAGERVIHLDPGGAFGTGLHASTRLCLRALSALDNAGFVPAQTLDFGCGTGILGFGAVLLWRCEVVAVDDDPVALEACLENAEHNDMVPHVVVAQACPERDFDLIVANVSRPVLTEVAPLLRSALRPGGRLILSGLLTSDRDAIEAVYEALGMQTLSVTQEGEWLALLLRSGVA